MDQPNMEGRVCLITGASSGIGRSTAARLAALGATVVMVSRAGGQGPRAAEEIRSATGSKSVHFMPCDLSSLQSIRDFTIAFRERHKLLHVLINNAGGVYSPRRESVDGFELTFAVNHLARFLLTHLLLHQIEAAAPSRIINVASRAHTMGRIDFDDLQSTQNYKPFRVYAHSKLANILFTYELARRLAGTGVTVNTLHPGTVRTGFGDTTVGAFKLFITAIRPFLLSPDQGAETPVFLASSPGVEQVTGNYFESKRAIKSSRSSYNVETARRLWDVSAELVNLPHAAIPANR